MNGYSVIEKGGLGYPEPLSRIRYPPKLLHVLGSLPEAKHWVAIVGSRRATQYGFDVAHSFAADLAAAGVVVVSGLATGIDSAAHQGALRGNGLTVGVLGGGFERIYPAGNIQLVEKIVANGGAVLSEYAPAMPPSRGQFPARNRIVAGLCSITVVVEAVVSSASLITANMALDENRDVMAVPGNINQPGSVGCNNLIKAGAAPVTDVNDIFEKLGLEPAKDTKLLARGHRAQKLHQLILSGVSDVDELIKRTDLEASEISSQLTELELSGYVKSLGGGQWSV